MISLQDVTRISHVLLDNVSQCYHVDNTLFKAKNVHHFLTFSTEILES